MDLTGCTQINMDQCTVKIMSPMFSLAVVGRPKTKSNETFSPIEVPSIVDKVSFDLVFGLSLLFKIIFLVSNVAQRLLCNTLNVTVHILPKIYFFFINLTVASTPK